VINGNVAMADGQNNTEEDMEDGTGHTHSVQKDVALFLIQRTCVSCLVALLKQ
jgi:hypothetical protein